MAVPDFQTIMAPLLKYMSDGQEHTSRDAIEHLASEFRVSDKERAELLPSGQQSIFDNRVQWAVSHLKHAGLMESIRRGNYKITERGVQVLKDHPNRVDMRILSQFAEYEQFRSGSRKYRNGPPSVEHSAVIEQPDVVTQQPPEELLAIGYLRARQDLAQDLLARVKAAPPSFFERLVVELLVKMGYGGSRKDAGAAIGKSGDGGIDGIINEDRLGLDVIYIQAKRWEGVVGRPEIHKFVGALSGQRARKGVIITTSDFTRDAREYASSIDIKVVLVDGEQLAQLMIDHDVGVTRVSTYDIKRIDSDYFDAG